jgi:hypothetical protein
LIYLKTSFYEVYENVSLFYKLSNFVKFLGRKKEAGLMSVGLDNRPGAVKIAMCPYLAKPENYLQSRKSCRYDLHILQGPGLCGEDDFRCWG